MTTSQIPEIPEQKILTQLDSLVGETPLLEFPSLSSNPRVRIFAKAEWLQPGGSVKSRPAWNIIRAALLSGNLKKGQRLLDASSGNTAIAYATFAARLGLPVTLCIPENATPQRKNILRALGAELIFTSPFEGSDGAQDEARRLKLANPDRYYYADQYANEYNWRAHYQGTGPEIFRQTQGRITHFVTGLGTTGTFTGTGRRLRELKPEVQLIALQPDGPMHGLEGWKHLETAKVPQIFAPGLPDMTFTVATEAAYETLKKVALREGLLLSPSAGANLAGAAKFAETLESGTVVTVLPDDSAKYPEIFEIINQ